MFLGIGKGRRNRFFVAIAVSIVAYAISSVAAYVVAVSMPVPMTIISLQVGFVACTLVFLAADRERITLRPSRRTIPVWAYGICFALTGVLVFFAYQQYSLASIFPLMEGGVLVFLALDLAIHRGRVSRRTALFLAAGVATVFLGTYFAESTGLVFDLSALPYAAGIILVSGVGYYALANNVSSISGSSKNAAFTISALVSAAALLLFYNITGVIGSLDYGMFLLGAVSGFLLCLAFSMEMRAVRYGLGKNEGTNVAVRNFVNNSTEFDTVLVLLASIAIGSFSYESLFGGALIVAGVLVIGLAGR